MTVAPDELGQIGVQLGKGGEASVFELPGLTFPDVPGPLVYKRYRGVHGSPDSLRRVVAARNKLDGVTRGRLDAIAAWPVRVVEEQGQAVGIVMPRIPGAYFDRVQRNSGVKHSLREVQNLFIDPARAIQVGRPAPTDEERLRICRDFAGGLAFLHEELKVVFGDLNAMNEVFRVDAEPMVMFLDCDAVRPNGVVARVKQLNAPDWLPPEGGALTLATDHYKLGLFILRCLTPGSGSSVKTDPDAAAARLDDESLVMLRRALGRDPADRPTAREWEVRLRRLLGESLVPPRLGEVRVDRTLILSGQSTVVEWEALEANWIEIVAGARSTRVDGGQGRGRTPIELERSGRIRVRAVNNLGADERELGPVRVVSPPDVHQLPIPMPQVHWPVLDIPGPPGLELLPLPHIDVRPDVPELFTTGGQDVTWPAMPAPQGGGFPFDLQSMLTNSPEIDFGSRDGEGAGR